MNAATPLPPLSSRGRMDDGFTLLEMLVVMAISAVLMSVVAPSFSSIIDSAKVTSATNVFLSGLHLARSEAIKRNSRVALCKTADGVACASSGGEQGWIVFHDANNNGSREGSEPIIQREMALSSSLRLTGNQYVARYVSFTPTGGTRLIGGNFQAGTLTVCRQSAQGGEARQIILNAVGRPRVKKAALANCI